MQKLCGEMGKPTKAELRHGLQGQLQCHTAHHGGVGR